MDGTATFGNRQCSTIPACRCPSRRTRRCLWSGPSPARRNSFPASLIGQPKIAPPPGCHTSYTSLAIPAELSFDPFEILGNSQEKDSRPWPPRGVRFQRARLLPAHPKSQLVQHTANGRWASTQPLCVTRLVAPSICEPAADLQHFATPSSCPTSVAQPHILSRRTRRKGRICQEPSATSQVPICATYRRRTMGNYVNVPCCNVRAAINFRLRPRCATPAQSLELLHSVARYSLAAACGANR